VKICQNKAYKIIREMEKRSRNLCVEYIKQVNFDFSKDVKRLRNQSKHKFWIKPKKKKKNGNNNEFT